MKFVRSLFAWLKSRWFSCLLWLAAIAIAAAIGLQMTGWVALKMGKIPLRFGVLQSPVVDFASGAVKMIESAKTEVLLSAPSIDSEAVLTALQAAEKRGVSVKILLSPDSVSPTSGALGWLRHYGVGSVFTERYPFAGVTMVVDGKFALVSTLPLAPKGVTSERAGTSLFVNHKDLVGELRSAFGAQVARSKPERNSK